LEPIFGNYWTLSSENMRLAASYILYWSSTYMLPQAAFFPETNYNNWNNLVH